MSDDIYWESGKRRLGDLEPAKYNPRKWTDEQINNLSDSLQRFSIVDPIYYQFK